MSAANALLEKNSKENAFFAEVWQSQKDFARIAVHSGPVHNLQMHNWAWPTLTA